VSRSNRVIVCFTVADLDTIAGRQLTEGEIRKIEKSIGWSGMGDDLAELVFSVIA
jgi:hypothetical protein